MKKVIKTRGSNGEEKVKVEGKEKNKNEVINKRVYIRNI